MITNPTSAYCQSDGQFLVLFIWFRSCNGWATTFSTTERFMITFTRDAFDGRAKLALCFPSPLLWSPYGDPSTFSLPSYFLIFHPIDRLDFFGNEIAI